MAALLPNLQPYTDHILYCFLHVNIQIKIMSILFIFDIHTGNVNELNFVWHFDLEYCLCNSQCEFPETPHGHTQGILTFEKMCCQSPFYGSNVPCHKCISALGYIDFYVKMLLDGCSIPNNAPWLPVLVIYASPLTHVLSYKYKNWSMWRTHRQTISC